MGLFGGPGKKLRWELEAGQIALRLPSQDGEEAKLNRIVNQIHQAALPVVAKSGKSEAVRLIDEARFPEKTDDLSALWREMLDTVAAHL